MTVLISLIPVLCIVACRDWLEDVKRKKADTAENNTLVERVVPAKADAFVTPEAGAVGKRTALRRQTVSQN